MYLYAMKAVLDNLMGYVVANRIGWREEYICGNAVQMEYIHEQNALKITAPTPDNHGTMHTMYSVRRKFYV